MAEEGLVGYPDDLLGEGESVVVHRHPHWRMLVLPLIVFVVVVGVAVYLATVVASTSWYVPAWIALGVVGAVLIVWLTLAPVFRWRTTHFVVTTHRMMVREGVFTRSGIDIPMSRIDSVRSRRGVVDRLLGCGTLIVESASNEPLEFDDIPDVEGFHALLYLEDQDPAAAEKPELGDSESGNPGSGNQNQVESGGHTPNTARPEHGES